VGGAHSDEKQLLRYGSVRSNQELKLNPGPPGIEADVLLRLLLVGM
jgi:hypothetical protein